MRFIFFSHSFHLELLKRSVFAESQLCGKFEGTSTKTSLMHYELRFPIDDEDGVELLETMVQCNDSVRREYVSRSWFGCA